MSDTITVWDSSYVTDPHLIQELFPPVPHEYPVIDSKHVEDGYVTFLHFDCEDVGPVAAIVYDDEPGRVFTPEDWQGVQPESIEDAEDWYWLCYAKEGFCTCVNQDGLPRTFDPTESLLTLWDGDYRLSKAYDSSDPIILGALAEDPDLEVRLAVACNPYTPEDALRKFTRNEETAKEALLNPSVSVEAVIDAMFSDDDAVSECALEVWEYRIAAKMANDEDYQVRLEVAGNPNTPSEVLGIMAKIADTEMLEAIASNRSTPKETLKALARHEEDGVRLLVAWNESTPRDALEWILQNDENPDVRKSADYGLALLDGHESPSARAEAAKRAASEAGTMRDSDDRTLRR